MCYVSEYLEKLTMEVFCSIKNEILYKLLSYNLRNITLRIYILSYNIICNYVHVFV